MCSKEDYSSNTQSAYLEIFGMYQTGKFVSGGPRDIVQEKNLDFYFEFCS